MLIKLLKRMIDEDVADRADRIKSLNREIEDMTDSVVVAAEEEMDGDYWDRLTKRELEKDQKALQIYKRHQFDSPQELRQTIHKLTGLRL